MRRSIAATMLALVLPAAALPAQERPDTLPPVPVAPVVVTVLRAPVELRAAPYAVSVVVPDAATRAQPGLALDELLRGVPGVQVDNRHNYAVGERITIRGFGARAQFGVRGVRVMLDGVPATLPDGQTALEHIDLSTIGRVEVIRGPASALYGNAAGGVIQFETREPPAAPIAQEVGVTAGGHGSLRLSSTVGGQIGGASYLVGAGRLRYDGYRDHSAAENRYFNARVGLTGRGHQLRMRASFVDYDAQNPGSLSDSLVRVDRFQAFAGNVAQQTGKTGRQAQLGAQWLHARGPGQWELSGYLVSREITNPIAVRIIDLDRTGGGARAIYRAAPLGVRVPIRWTLGVESDAQRDDRRNHVNRAGERAALVLDQAERVVTLAGFGQLAAELAPGVSLLGGVRYDDARFHVRDRLVGGADPDDSGERRMRQLSPSVGLTLGLAPGVQLFGNVSTAFETPTTTELANRPTGAGGFNPELEPQRTLSSEIGVRGGVGTRAELQLTVYDARVRNALIPFEVPEAAGRQFFRNAGSTSHRGVELALGAAPLPGLRADLAYTRTDVRFRDFTTRLGRFDGNRVPGVAPHRADLRVRLDLPAATFVQLDARHSARVPVDDGNTAHSAAWTVADLRLGARALPAGPFLLRPFAGVTNVLDARYDASVVVNAAGARFFEPGPGRALYLGATAAWGAR